MGTIIHNGRTIDEDTGEVLDEQGQATAERFEVTDIETLKWFVRKLKRKDTIIEALYGELAEVTTNISREIETKKSERESFYARFVDGARSVAAQALDGQDSKTFKTPFGNAKFRTVPGGAITILDENKAIDAALRICPAAITTETITKISKAELKKVADKLPRDIFEISADRETFEIVTTIKDKK